MRAAVCSTAKFDVSAATAASGMPSTMDDGKYDDLVGHRVEVDRVRKASHERAAGFALDARVRERGLNDAGKRPVDLRRKGSAKPRTLFVVPVTSVE